jgi:hypothetical protein
VDPSEYYKPPRADLAAPEAPAGSPLAQKLYSVRQITVTTFFGGPLAGTVLMAANFRALGRLNSVRNSYIAGVVGTLAVIALAMALPDRVPSYALPLMYVLSVQAVAKHSLGALLTAHFQAGGAKQSSWRATGIAAACLAGMMVVGFALAVLFAFKYTT